MKSILLISLCLFAFIGCKKGKAEFTIKGILTDQTFNVPFAGATVTIYENEASGGQSNPIGELTTDSNGSYSFTFLRNQVLSYTLVAEKNNYFNLEETIPFADLTIDEDNLRNFSTTALAWVSLRFVNQSPLPSDILKYTKQEGKSGCVECCAEGDQFLNGLIDTTIYCVNNGNAIYSYYYVEMGTANQGFKSATTLAFDTTEILLNY